MTRLTRATMRLGLAVAILIGVTPLRMVLVPSRTAPLGRNNRRPARLAD